MDQDSPSQQKTALAGWPSASRNFPQQYSRKTLLAVLGLLWIVPESAHAYIDPGTGSIVVQSLIAGVLAGLVFIKLFAARCIEFVRRCFKGSTDSDKNQNSTDE